MFLPWGPLLEIGTRRPRAGAAWERIFPPGAVVFTKGRFAFLFRLRKMAPVPDGAVLVVKAPLAATGVAPTGRRSRIREKLAQMALERIAFTLGWNVLAIKERLIGKRLVAGERLGGTPLVREVG